MIITRNLLLLIIIFTTFCACHDKATGASNSGTMPNSDTEYVSLNTVHKPDNTALLESLEKKLAKDNFTFTKDKADGDISFKNCDTNTIFTVEGNGSVSYYAKSKISMGGQWKNTYADFGLTIFTFEDAATAKETVDIIEAAFKTIGSDDYCNGKAPKTLVRIDNDVYLLATRANMFETYTVKYAKYIKDFKP